MDFILIFAVVVQFSLTLEDMENWLYEDGEYAERSVYQVQVDLDLDLDLGLDLRP